MPWFKVRLGRERVETVEQTILVAVEADDEAEVRARLSEVYERVDALELDTWEDQDTGLEEREQEEKHEVTFAVPEGDPDDDLEICETRVSLKPTKARRRKKATR